MNRENNDQVAVESVRFLSLVSMLATSAYMALGKVANPQDGKVSRNLDEARGLIDLLSTLKKKTSGNLDRRESDYLESVLTDLRLNYVREKDRPEGEESPPAGGGAAGSKPGEAPPGPEKPRIIIPG